MSLIKIINGTRTDTEGKRLCDSCRFSTIIRGAAESQELVLCSRLEANQGVVPMRVVECSEYNNKSLPSLSAMQDIAWVLVTDKSGKKIGFMAADKWRKENKYEELIPERFS